MLVLADCNAAPRVNVYDSVGRAGVQPHHGKRSAAGEPGGSLNGHRAQSEIWVGVCGGAATWLPASAWFGTNVCGAAPSIRLRVTCRSRSSHAAKAAGMECPRYAWPPDAD